VVIAVLIGLLLTQELVAAATWRRAPGNELLWRENEPAADSFEANQLSLRWPAFLGENQEPPTPNMTSATFSRRTLKLLWMSRSPIVSMIGSYKSGLNKSGKRGGMSLLSAAVVKSAEVPPWP
jgi:hypothetical protein